MTTTNDTQARAVLAAGLGWLYETEQPDGVVLQHHGVSSPRVGDRWYRFIPAGARRRPVVVVYVADPQYDKTVPGWKLLNPLGGDREMVQLALVIRDLGYDFCDWWNGKDEAGSLGLVELAHPTLVDAVDTYRGGCPEHPKASVFCDCPWYDRGQALLVKPTWPAVTAHCPPPVGGRNQDGR